MAKASFKNAVEELPAQEEVAVATVHTLTDAEKIERQRQEESVKIKGTFQDNELKGGSIAFSFKKFPGDDIVNYHLYDGQEYELPLSVVKHLNSGCYYSTDTYSPNSLLQADGKPMKNTAAKKFHRFSFKVSGYG